MLVFEPLDFGLCCRARRLYLKLTQADVARAVGTGRQWIVALERGKPGLDFGLVLKTMDTLGLDIGVHCRDELPAWSLPFKKAAANKPRLSHARRCPVGWTSNADGRPTAPKPPIATDTNSAPPAAPDPDFAAWQASLEK